MVWHQRADMDWYARPSVQGGIGMSRRVVVTGLGAVTPIGIGVEAFWQGILEGKTGFAPI